MHHIDIPAVIDERCKRRRGRVQVFDSIDPKRTAHIAVDMQNSYVAPGSLSEVLRARGVVPYINKISAACRSAGALNVFLQHTITESTKESWSTWYNHFASPERRSRMTIDLADGSFGHQLWSGLNIADSDIRVKKHRFSAFVEGSSGLHSLLQEREIDTLIITGTLTNICCDSTARDAMMMNYKVLFVADACATHTDVNRPGI